MLRQTMIRLIKDGKNIIIDFGFWNKDDRKLYKNIIEKAGGSVELVYMKASRELLQKRIAPAAIAVNVATIDNVKSAYPFILERQ